MAGAHRLQHIPDVEELDEALDDLGFFVRQVDDGARGNLARERLARILTDICQIEVCSEYLRFHRSWAHAPREPGSAHTRWLYGP